MTRTLPLLLLLAACTQKTSLTTPPNNTDIVSGSGKIQVDPAEVFVKDIEVGYSKSEPIVVSSIGDGDLYIYEAKIVADASDAFYFEEAEDIQLAPGQSVTWYVVGDLNEALPADGQLRFRTNDADAASLIIPIHAWPQGYEPEDTGDSGGHDSGGDSGTP